MTLESGKKKKAKDEEDIESYCGSISGETFSSRRKRNVCTLRQHGVDALAARLRQSSFDQAADAKVVGVPGGGARLNTRFHHFRFLMVTMGGFSVGTVMLLRYNITVAILNMVNQTALYMTEHPNRTIEDFLAEGYSTGGEFEWDNEIQQMIMSWYMIAYTLPQMPCTKLGLMVGSRLTIPISLSICAISTLLTPMAAYYGWEYVLGLRLINGIGAASVLPMMLSLIENWMPFDQISLGLTCAQLIQAVTTAANPLVAGCLSAIHWSYAFYVPACIALAFCALWLVLVTDRPDENPYVSQKELAIICGCTQDHDHAQYEHINYKANQLAAEKEEKERKRQQLADPAKGKQMAEFEEEELAKPIWSDVFRVPSFYAYIFMWCLHCSGFSVFTFILPTYLRQFLKIAVSENGIYCFIIQTGMLISVIWPHPFLEFLQGRLNFSMTAARRLTYLIVCLAVASTWFYVGQFHSLQLIMLFIGRCFHGSNDIVVTGSLMSNYSKAGLSSLVFSMVNTVGNFSIVFFSPLAGYVLDQTGQSAQGWSWIFSSLALSQLIMCATFGLVIRSEPIEFKEKRKMKTTTSKEEIRRMENGSSIEKGEKDFTASRLDEQQVGKQLSSVEIINSDDSNGLENNFEQLRSSKKEKANN